MSNTIGNKRIDKSLFFDQIRVSLFKGSLTQSQVKGIDTIVNEFELREYSDKRWLAYMLATAFHETAQTMQAIEEYGKGKGYDYGKKLKRSRVPYHSPDKLYYGRGLVQLTWYENYQYMGKLLGIDLLNNPEKALDLEVAVKIMFEGMLKGKSSFGDFTGVSLEKYFNATTDDWTNARKIINGLDCAEKIAEYGRKFHKALV